LRAKAEQQAEIFKLTSDAFNEERKHDPQMSSTVPRILTAKFVLRVKLDPTLWRKQQSLKRADYPPSAVSSADSDGGGSPAIYAPRRSCMADRDRLGRTGTNAQSAFYP